MLSPRLKKTLLVSVLVALGLGAAFGFQAMYLARVQGRATDPELVVWWQMVPWLAWVPFVPLIEVIARWIRSLLLGLLGLVAIHLSAGIVVAALHVVITGLIIRPGAVLRTEGLLETLGMLLSMRVPTEILIYALIATVFHLILELEALREARRALQRQQRESMEAVGRLAGGIAHDFNNLLTSIEGNAGLIGMDPDLPAGAREDVRAIEEASRRAAGITARLLALGQRHPHAPETLDLTRTIGELTPELREAVGTELRLRVSLPEGPVPVKFDLRLLRQVLVELVSNAREATPPGGRISVRLERKERAGEEDGSEVPEALLEIRDSGRGMPPDRLRRAFEPFFTSRPTTTGGGGLGLAVVKGIVEQAGGEVILRSRLGRGTRARIRLPLAGDAGAESPG